MPSKPEQLRALSIRQPWVELILRGEQTDEFRSQATSIRGRVYLFASQAKPEPGDEEVSGDLPRGVSVGTVEIAGCEGEFGEYAWLLENPQRLSEPIAPQEQPQPVWFYPFGRAEDAYTATDDATPATDDSQPTAKQFAPVIAATDAAPFTPYHATYLAYELTKRVGADQADKLAQSLSNATVDLNPHKVDAALFAFRSAKNRRAGRRSCPPCAAVAAGNKREGRHRQGRKRSTNRILRAVIGSARRSSTSDEQSSWRTEHYRSTSANSSGAT